MDICGYLNYAILYSLVVFRQDRLGLPLLHLWAYSHLPVDPHMTESITNIAVLGNCQLVFACLDKLYKNRFFKF